MAWLIIDQILTIEIRLFGTIHTSDSSIEIIPTPWRFYLLKKKCKRKLNQRDV